MKELLNYQTILNGTSPWRVCEFVVEDKPVIIRAFGLQPDDLVCVTSLKKSQSTQPNITSTDCGVNLPTDPLITGEQYFVDCGVKVCICKIQPWTIINLPGNYRLEVSGSGFDTYRSVTIDTNNYTGSADISCCEQCKACIPTYCPSQALLGGGFGFHINDPKDPAATVAIAPCPSDTSVDPIYIYPTASKGRTVRVEDCDGVLIGYGVNKSDCAIVMPAPVPVTINNFSPVNTFSPTPPVNNITLPSPSLVAASYDSVGNMTLTNSDGSQVKANNFPVCS